VGAKHIRHRQFRDAIFDFVALRLDLVAADARHFRIGEHAEWHDAILRGSIAALQVVTHDSEVVVRDVCELRTARAIAHRPHVGCGRLQSVVYLDIATLVELDADIAAGNDLPRKVDPALLKAVARSRIWFEELASGRTPSLADIARRENIAVRYVERLSRVAFVAPSIVEAICQGQQPAELNVETLLNRIDLPLEWPAQLSALGID
jgi:hypothetical protein